MNAPSDQSHPPRHRAGGGRSSVWPARPVGRGPGRVRRAGAGRGSAPGPDQAVSTKPVSIQAGEALYNAHCAACHGIGAVGAKGPELLNVGAAAVDFFLSTGRMPLATPTLEPQPRTSPISTRPRSPTSSPTSMPWTSSTGPRGRASPTSRRRAPTRRPSAPPLSEGNELFLLNCAQCHDASGAGGMLSHGYVVPSLRQATPTQIAEAIRVGPRPMPNFGPGQLTDQQVSAIADYVYNLNHTQPTPAAWVSPTSAPSPRASWASSSGLASCSWSPADREPRVARWPKPSPRERLHRHARRPRRAPVPAPRPGPTTSPRTRTTPGSPYATTPGGRGAWRCVIAFFLAITAACAGSGS